MGRKDKEGVLGCQKEEGGVFYEEGGGRCLVGNGGLRSVVVKSVMEYWWWGKGVRARYHEWIHPGMGGIGRRLWW